MTTTTDTLDLTKPSREIDALVAEDIMEIPVSWVGMELDGEPLDGRYDDRCELIPDYLCRMESAWLVMENMHDRMFSVRRRFWTALLTIIREEIQTPIAWPDALMHIDARRICAAALRALKVVE